MSNQEFWREYVDLLGANGYVHLTNVPEEFDHAAFLSRFGDFIPGPSGRLIDDIVPEPDMDDVYYGGNRRALMPHTEGYEYVGLPPRYLALWCVSPPAGGGGETTLLDAAPMLRELDMHSRRHLETFMLDWLASEGLHRRGLGRRTTHPMLESVDGLTVLRFSYNNVRFPGDRLAHEVEDPAAVFLRSVNDAFESDHIEIHYAVNDLLHWDNWRLLHSRTAFEDFGRHLKRVQIRHTVRSGS